MTLVILQTCIDKRTYTDNEYGSGMCVLSGVRQRTERICESTTSNLRLQGGFFDDPWAISVVDSLHDEDEQRFVTIGAIGSGSVLYVVHTWDCPRRIGE